MIGFSNDSSLAELGMMAEGKMLSNSTYRMELNADVPVSVSLTEEASQRRLELIREAAEGRK